MLRLDDAVPTVARWCARLGGPKVDPEDAAQDVMATATRRLHSLRDPDHLEPWLFGITRRVLAAHRRRAWLRRWVAAPSGLEPDPGAGPERLAEARQRAAQLQQWLETLPTAQREVVVLCALEERSSPAVAELLGIPVGTVKSRLRLGMARLRALAEAS
ncbi:MAG: sigma-70 family RNA polymerase sigma factor [Myxococcales bacterium]|nr:sigma-70 family RNA polymerase sigma factor [Myxococcales bacterium]